MRGQNAHPHRKRGSKGLTKSHLTGDYLRVFQKYADQGGNIPSWSIMPFAAEIVDIAARELGGEIRLLGIAHNIGVNKVVKNGGAELLNPDEYGAIYVFSDEHISYIVYDEKRTKQEQRFTLAHEIGHYMLHVRDNGRGGYYLSAGAKTETEADVFAGALLYFIDQRINRAAA